MSVRCRGFDSTKDIILHRKYTIWQQIYPDWYRRLRQKIKQLLHKAQAAQLSYQHDHRLRRWRQLCNQLLVPATSKIVQLSHDSSNNSNSLQVYDYSQNRRLAHKLPLRYNLLLHHHHKLLCLVAKLCSRIPIITATLKPETQDWRKITENYD